MKIRLGDLRRLIREALGGEDLAVYMWNSSYMTRIGGSSSSVKLVLYSPSELLGLDWKNTFDRPKLGSKEGTRVRRVVGRGEPLEIPKSVLKGYAAYGQPENPCNGAWEVSSIAGVGYGKLLYGIGYYLSPRGRIMPDRYYSSKRARDAWTKAAPAMKGYPLDDIENPKTPEKEDDCKVQIPTKKGGPDPVLDVAYEGPPVDPGPMVAIHEETVDKLTKIFNDLGDELSQQDVEKMLDDMFRKASTKFFTSEFEKYYKEK